MNTIWFDLTLLNGITALGSIFFGHFEKHTPKWKRVSKLTVLNLLTAGIHLQVGQVFSLGLLGVLLFAVVIIHAFVLPSKGIHGWTGEPKEKYYRLRGWDKYLLNEKDKGV